MAMLVILCTAVAFLAVLALVLYGVHRIRPGALRFEVSFWPPKMVLDIKSRPDPDG